MLTDHNLLLAACHSGFASDSERHFLSYEAAKWVSGEVRSVPTKATTLASEILGREVRTCNRPVPAYTVDGEIVTLTESQRMAYVVKTEDGFRRGVFTFATLDDAVASIEGT